METVDVVIPAWNGREVVAACLQSATALAPNSVVAVDNASVDGTRELLRRTAPWIRVIEHDRNYGFAAACNRGLRETRAPYVLFINQDVVVLRHGITDLLNFLERNPRCAAAGGRIENPDGTLQPSMGPEPHPLRAVLDRIPGLRLLISSHVYRHPRAYEFPKQPAWLTGACLLIRRAAFDDVGPFDEEYFMYTEDLDWCARARKRQWTIQYLPVRTAVHADEGRRPDRARAKATWMRKGLLRYFTLYGTPGQARLFRFLVTVRARVRTET